MGTNGYFVFKYKGFYYAIYNHYDSYFSGLGNQLLNEIKNMLKENKLEEWKNKFEKLIILKYINYSNDLDISKKNRIKLIKIAGKKNIDMFLFNIQKECTGSYLKTLNSGILIADIITNKKEEILMDNICIEYIYILDLDENLFITIDKNNNSEKTYFLFLPYKLD